MFSKFKNKTIHPEFLQENVTVSNLIAAFREYDREGFLENSQELRAYLKHGSSVRVAELINS